MGQYYTPTVIKSETRKVKSSHDVEAWFYPHSYGEGLKLMEHSYKGGSLVNAVRNWLIDNGGGNLVWAGDYADEEAKGKPNIYTISNDEGIRETDYTDEDRAGYHFYNNHDKHEFVDLDKCLSKNEWSSVIDPLPILTCEGNGRGSGDYEGSSMALVGTWARDFITCSMAPTEGYKEIIPDFKEKY